MPENRQYAGPFDAAELMVDDGRYALVVRKDITDDQAEALGYVFDGDEAVRTGRSMAVRTITVSDELALKLNSAGFEVDGEFVPSWPKIGGTPAAQTVDVPESNPSTMPVTLENGDTITAAEADERAYTAGEADEVLDRAAIDAAGDTNAPDDNRDELARRRIGDIDARLEAIEAALESDDDINDAELDALTDEQTRLNAERADIAKALEGGSN